LPRPPCSPLFPYTTLFRSLTGAGLMIESVAHLLHVDPGFDPQNLLRVELELPSDKYFFHDRAAQRKVLYAQLHERLAALPGVKADRKSTRLNSSHDQISYA